MTYVDVVVPSSAETVTIEEPGAIDTAVESGEEEGIGLMIELPNVETAVGIGDED